MTELDLFYFLDADPPSMPQPQHLSETSQRDFKPFLSGLFPTKTVGRGKKAETKALSTAEKINYILSNKGWLQTTIVYDLAREDQQLEVDQDIIGPKAWKHRKDGYCNKIRLPSEKALHDDHNYVLGAAYHSDGKVLTLLANDTRAPKTYRKKKSISYSPDEEEIAAAAAAIAGGEDDDCEDDNDECDDDAAQGINLSEYLYKLDQDTQYEYQQAD